VFLWTDHGISHARGKQFLYDEGSHVPLIIRCPDRIEPGTVREDLVSHIDIAATSLHFAGIPIPQHMQGRPLFGPDYKPRDYIFAARDRCDETLDCIRCVRAKRYKYIRNFYPDRPHLQPNRYKDNKQIIKTMQKLLAEGKLNPLQARVFASTRPAEELYDLQNDPYEINNLADSPEHQDTLKHLRATLLEWMRQTKDLGLVPEPQLEQLARKYESRYAVLRHKDNEDLIGRILKVSALGEQDKVVRKLIRTMKDSRPSIRWWAARKLGNLGWQAGDAVPVLRVALKDNSAGVRVEAARALCKMEMQAEALPVLLRGLKNSDQVVRHYAALALEDIGEESHPLIGALRAAEDDDYEYVRRLANRLVGIFESEEHMHP
jgi:uncharacterized sulfatase